MIFFVIVKFEKIGSQETLEKMKSSVFELRSNQTIDLMSKVNSTFMFHLSRIRCFNAKKSATTIRDETWL